VSYARYLRKHPTKWERILWRHPRNRNFADYKFRRQHPFHRYVFDFYCPAAKLAIELDGGGHNYQSGQLRDRTREEFLARHGIEVLRFWNRQVREELNSVLTAIWLALEKRTGNNPHLNPLPLRKGEANSRRARDRAHYHPQRVGQSASPRFRGEDRGEGCMTLHCVPMLNPHSAVSVEKKEVTGFASNINGKAI
jgi:very-short-patch-repair endonuclease